jgi:hypothetical protein
LSSANFEEILIGRGSLRRAGTVIRNINVSNTRVGSKERDIKEVRLKKKDITKVGLKKKE